MKLEQEYKDRAKVRTQLIRINNALLKVIAQINKWNYGTIDDKLAMSLRKSRLDIVFTGNHIVPIGVCVTCGDIVNAEQLGAVCVKCRPESEEVKAEAAMTVAVEEGAKPENWD